MDYTSILSNNLLTLDDIRNRRLERFKIIIAEIEKINSDLYLLQQRHYLLKNELTNLVMDIYPEYTNTKK